MHSTNKGRTTIYVGLVLLNLSMTPGCSGDENQTASSSTGSTGGVIVDWGAYCDARAILQCPKFDASECMQQQACAQALIRDEVEMQILDCLREACGWESCLAKTAEVPLSSAGEAFRSACVERTMACGLGNDTCYAGNIIADTGIGELSACLDRATCNDTDTCMTDYFATQFEACTAWH
jgi:hypothetical protein